ncbi:MAG TPA: hypothetical protein VFV50_01490 [Bdellovibrionales bacterium]|nr:hypothetical protein [Bdellovibrionales bacterium]
MNAMLVTALLVSGAAAVQAADLPNGTVINTLVSSEAATVYQVKKIRVLSKDPLPTNGSAFVTLRLMIDLQVEGNLCGYQTLALNVVSLANNVDPKKRIETSRSEARLVAIKPHSSQDQIAICAQYSRPTNISVPLNVSMLMGPPATSLIQKAISETIVRVFVPAHESPNSRPSQKFENVIVTLAYGDGWSVTSSVPVEGL